MAHQMKTPASKVGLLGQLFRSVRLVWRLLNDPRVPLLNKLVIPGLFLVYLLWPVDLMPDVLPVIGQMDDLALLALAVKLFIDLCPTSIVSQHRDDIGQGDQRVQGEDAAKEVVDAEYRIVE